MMELRIVVPLRTWTYIPCRKNTSRNAKGAETVPGLKHGKFDYIVTDKVCCLDMPASCARVYAQHGTDSGRGTPPAQPTERLRKQALHHILSVMILKLQALEPGRSMMRA